MNRAKQARNAEIVRDAVHGGMSYRQLAEKYGMTRSGVYRIVTNAAPDFKGQTRRGPPVSTGASLEA